MKPPIVVAHRGLHVEHVENTLPALHAAWEAGIHWCEIDVRGSIEHEPFLMHDETLERTAGAAGAIAQTASATLDRLGVPTLERLIAQMPVGAKLLVEIKPGVDFTVVRRTLEICDPARCIIQSFDVELLRHAASLREDFKLHLLVDDAKAIAGGPWDAINAQFKTLEPATVQSIRDHGFGVGAWTVNTALDIERMLALNVDRIITDEPLRARDICGKIG